MEPSIFNDLLSYLEKHIKNEAEAELIRFVAGVYDRKLKKRHISIEEIELHHLENLKSEEYICIIF